MRTDPSGRVLVADSAERVRTELHQALLNREIFCDCAISAGNAIACMRESDYALILLDLALPNAGAAAVLEEIRSLPAASRPIVLATAPRADLGRESESELVHIVLRKPLRIIEVAEMIHACVESIPPRGILR